jgi:hypothetical protein
MAAVIAAIYVYELRENEPSYPPRADSKNLIGLQHRGLAIEENDSI